MKSVNWTMQNLQDVQRTIMFNTSRKTWLLRRPMMSFWIYDGGYEIWQTTDYKNIKTGFLKQKPVMKVDILNGKIRIKNKTRLDTGEKIFRYLNTISQGFALMDSFNMAKKYQEICGMPEDMSPDTLLKTMRENPRSFYPEVK